MNKIITTREVTDEEAEQLAALFEADQIITTKDETKVSELLVKATDDNDIVILYGKEAVMVTLKAIKYSRIINTIPASGFFIIKNKKCWFLGIADNIKSDKSVMEMYATIKRNNK